MLKKIVMILVFIGFAVTNSNAAGLVDRDGNGIFQEQIVLYDPEGKGWLTMAEKRIILKPDPSGRVYIQRWKGGMLTFNAIKKGDWVAVKGYQRRDLQARVMNIFTNRIYVLQEKLSDEELVKLFSE